MPFRFISCHPIQRNFLDRLPFNAVRWGESVNASSALVGTIPLPASTQKIDSLLLATEPDEAAVYVQNGLSEFVWGGVVVEQNWDQKKRIIEIAVADWRSYLYSVFLSPKLDLTADNVYTWVAKDQLQIAREIVGNVTLANGGQLDGRPAIQIGGETSGVLRDLTFVGLDFKDAGGLLDSLSRRADGFEWDMYFGADTNGLPVLKLGLYYPERGALISDFMLRSTDQSNNFELTAPITKSSSDRRPRIWATGATSGARQEFAQDSDPAMADGFTLLREKSTAHSTVTDRTSLSEHAVAERRFLGVKTNYLSVRLRMKDTVDGPGIDPDSFRAGDRVRVVLKDEVYDIDLPAARFVQRDMRPYEAGGVMDCVLDLSDLEPPDVVA